MKIGIVTHYYKSINYGGNLQAYALCRKLGEEYDVEQIAIDVKTKKIKEKVFTKNGFLNILKEAKRQFGNFINFINLKKDKKLAKGLQLRRHAISQFNQEEIPHSKIVYTLDKIHEANNDYEVFITGSDQVWHPKAWNTAYRLDFVDKKKLKFSYAASIARSSLNNKEKDILKESLKNFDAISVRENEAVNIIAPISPVQVHWVLDPVFLLTQKEWDDICSERQVKEEYIFCYFLGESQESRFIAKEYAKRCNLKLITIPYLLGKFRKCDYDFGDEKLYEVSPKEFISLIKHSKAVFTDSFHALAFSIIYRKNFYVFNRSDSKNMSSRITSMLSIIGAEDRLIEDKEKIFELDSIDYDSPLNRIEKMKVESIRFLNQALKKESNYND